MKESMKKKITKMKEELDGIYSEIEDFKRDLQTNLDEKSENFREGNKGDNMQAEIDALENAADSMNDAVASLEEALEIE